ncbi:hypothetical protein CALCODRAFT_487833 [Calocera cornea HHB12733]|uniref:DUF6532 domain-containing protein n=1 Tax=Calocera cornea HHB12733 TaxID=1353952 RepID=A0A165CWU2_9BASI|nr:hypothetical protein CALCODRAFT_487833 [Calocera cornea HHB12733]
MKAEEAVHAYFIIPHGTHKKGIAEAIQWLIGTEERPNYRFIYANVEVLNEEVELDGMFLHEAIIYVAGHCFYNKPRATGDAVALPNFFTPFPSEGIMAICTALFHALSEWQSGQKEPIQFQASRKNKLAKRILRKNFRMFRKDDPETCKTSQTTVATKARALMDKSNAGHAVEEDPDEEGIARILKRQCRTSEERGEDTLGMTTRSPQSDLPMHRVRHKSTRDVNAYPEPVVTVSSLGICGPV